MSYKKWNFYSKSNSCEAFRSCDQFQRASQEDLFFLHFIDILIAI